MKSTLTGIIAAVAVITAFVAGTQIEYLDESAAEEISDAVEEFSES